MGEALEIAKALVSPTMKLMDMIGGAIGTAYEPRHKRKMADATAYEINAIGEAMRNAADLPIVYNQDGVAINSEDFNRLMQRAGTRLVLQETLKQHNIESVLDNAYDTLNYKEYCSEEPVDKDWVNTFFDSVANVSNEQMQMIWGKILAGEIEEPGSCSIRTLDTLKKMTHKEAELFTSLFPYILKCWGDEQRSFQDYFIAYNITEKININYPTIILLNEAGIISANSQISVGFSIAPFGIEYIDCVNSKIEITNLSNETINVYERAFILTEVGKTLYDVLCDKNSVSADKQYLYECGDYFSRKMSQRDSHSYKKILRINIIE